MKWPGLKFGTWSSKDARSAYEVAQDNITASNPPPKEKDVKAAVIKAALAIVELEKSVLRMLTGKKKNE